MGAGVHSVGCTGNRGTWILLSTGPAEIRNYGMLVLHAIISDIGGHGNFLLLLFFFLGFLDNYICSQKTFVGINILVYILSKCQVIIA